MTKGSLDHDAQLQAEESITNTTLGYRFRMEQLESDGRAILLSVAWGKLPLAIVAR